MFVMAVLATATQAEPVRVPEALGSSIENDAAHQQFVFAYRLLQRGENQLATEAFDEYLKKFPNDAKRGDGLYYRALLARKAGDNRLAASLLQKVGPTQVVPQYAVHLLQGQIHYDLGAYDHAVAALEHIQPDRLEPHIKASVLYLRGLAYRGVDNLSAAQDQLRQAAEIPGPLQTRAALDLARVLALMGQSSQALAALEPCLGDSDPDLQVQALCLAGDLSYQSSQYDRATRHYLKVLNDHPNSPQLSQAVVGLLWCRYQTRQYEALFQTFERHQATLSGDDRVVAWYLAGSAHQELGQHDQAIQTLNAIQVGAVDSPIHDKVLYKLAVSQFELGQIQEMAQTLATLSRVYPQSPLNTDATFLVAASAAKQGDAADGISRLTAIINLGPTQPYYPQALLQRAKLYEFNRQLHSAIDDYRQYLQATAHPARGRSEDTLQALGTESSTIPSLESPEPAAAKPAAGEGARNEVLLRLTDLYYELFNYEAAQAAASDLLAQDTLDLTTRQQAAYRLALAEIKLNNHQAAWQHLDQLLASNPPDPLHAHALYYRGLVAMALENSDAAVEDLLAASAKLALTNDLRANALRLVSIRQREVHQDAPAAQTLVQLESIVGTDSLEPHDLVWLGRHFLDQGDTQAAHRYLQPVLRAKTGVRPNLRAEALFLSGRLSAILGEWDQAITAFQHVIAVAAGFELQAKLELARALAQARRTDEALAAYTGLVTVEEADIASAALFDAGGLYRRIAQDCHAAGDHAAAEHNRQQARKLLNRLVLLYPYARLAPLPQRAFLELGELATQAGQPDQAQKEYRDMLEGFPDGPYAAYARAMIALSQNRQGDAQYLLSQLRGQDLDPYLAPRVEHHLSNPGAAP